MNVRKILGYNAKYVSNGYVGYLNEKEIRNICHITSKDQMSSDSMACDAIARSQHINNVVFSRMTK